jgi:rhodanese-related sulfurtransferase
MPVRRLVDGAIILLLLATAWRLLGASRQPNAYGLPATPLTPAVKSGDILRLPGVPVTADRTIMLFVSSTCPACNENLPFYRQLSALGSSDVALVAVSAEPTEVVSEWLRHGQVDVDSIHNVPAPLSYGLTLTPTVLVLDAEARVTDLMIRRLDNADQARLLTRLQNSEASRLDNSLDVREISDTEIENIKQQGIQTKHPAQLVDVRLRDGFRYSHREGARNIPAEELTARAPFELDPRAPVIIDCMQPGARATCRPAALMLRSLGFDSVFIVIR